VDPGSPADTLLTDPRRGLDALADATGAEFANLRAARAYTDERLKEMRGTFAGLDFPPELSVVVFGSCARGELTPGSDDDWALLVTPPLEPDDPEVERLFTTARRRLGAGERQPGSQDVFGVPFTLSALIQHVGLEEDSNRNLTRRMLLLLESTEVAGAAHDSSWAAVLDRYLNYGVKDYRPPRFLLNDLVRYWRTIAVDFEGKHAGSGGNDPKWVSRNAKLRTARKLLFAGGLLPVLLCEYRKRDEMEAFLTRWLTAPPTDRLAAAFLWARAADAGTRALTAYDHWIAIQRDADARAELARLRYATRHESPLFEEIRRIGREFERGLLSLLFDDTSPLSPLARRYLVF